MTSEFDLIVIGSGSAARSVAYPCREAGWKVALAESGPLGGTCALRGCDPKKVLVASAEAVDAAGALRGRGVSGAAKINWEELIAFKRSFTEPFPENMRRRLEHAGIEFLAGEAAFTGSNTVEVAGRNVSARNIVIATGAEPAPLNFPGDDLALTSDVFLDIARLPRRIAFIGGGYIAFEFAHIAVRAGAHVTIIHRGERPLEGFDADLVDRLCSFTRSLGVDIRVGAEVTALERAAGAVHVWVETNGPASRIEVDAVFHSAGRRPNLGDLRLDRGNVAFDRSGVVVNEWLQSTSNPSVWAAGDSAGTAMPRLTPVSAMHGVTVSHNLLQAERRRVDSRPVPTVVFTIPPLASVGLSEEQVSRRTRRENASAFVDTSEWYTSRRVGEICSGAKVLVDSESDQIVGAHLLGRGADEVINVFALAMRQGIPASELRQTPFSYPTKTSDIEYLV